jgi:ubiquitin carboxyl-terminal hydrolase 1
MKNLNTFHIYDPTLNPLSISRALLQSDKHRLLATREQQDAQEFLSLLLDTLDSESTRQYRSINKPAGLECIKSLDSRPSSSWSEISNDSKYSVSQYKSSPFEGLSAHRMGCLKCGYVENIRHERFGPMVLPLSSAREETLEECIHEAFKIETLEDVECPKCTLLAYRNILLRLVKTLSNTPSGTEAKKRLKAIDKALKSGKIEDTMLLGVENEKEMRKFIQRSPKTKHSMIARAPKILILHIQRSRFNTFPRRALKNQASVSFPMVLDISQFVTTPILSMDPREPISIWNEGDVRTVYRLKSVIVHYGFHNIGHYIAYRRAGDTWFRISDDVVEYVSRSS